MRCISGLNAVAILTSVALVHGAGAGDKPAGQDESPAKPPENDARFEKLKSLAGEWEVVKAPEGTPKGSTYTYKVTSGGSAVLETLFAGTEIEMISVYYVDGKDLLMTHYCMLKNQPHMRAENVENTNKLAFKCTEAAEKKIGAQDHMHAGMIAFVDADHIKSTWEAYKDGKGQGSNTFELRRKKK